LKPYNYDDGATAGNPRPPGNEIKRRIMVENQTHKDVLHWLATQGYTCKLPTLERWRKQWGFTRRGLSTEPAVVAYIDARFHSTFDNDETIAEQLNILGYPITRGYSQEYPSS